MAASLWVRPVASKQTTCHGCFGTVKERRLTKTNQTVYSVAEYVRGRRRNIINQVCRRCWASRCLGHIKHGVNPDIVCDGGRPHWMDLPWAEPRLTPEEIGLLDALCQFDVMPGHFVAVAVATEYKDSQKSFTDCLYVRTRDVQVDEDTAGLAAVRDWCDDHGVCIEENSRDVYVGMGECSLRHYVSFLLPRRDGQPHRSLVEVEASTAALELSVLGSSD